jgi:phosphoglycerate dehydrogenase-like enzyme
MPTVLFSPVLTQRGVVSLFQNALPNDANAAIQTSDHPAAFLAALKDAEVVVITGREPLDIANAPKLRWVFAHSAGIDNLPLAELKARGIPVTPMVGVNADAMAEHALLCLLALAKQLPAMVMAQAEKHWAPPLGHPLPKTGLPLSQQTRELAGATLGIVGFGRAGRASALRARAFGMRVLAFRRDPGDGTDPDADTVHALADLSEHLGDCDYVLLTAAGGLETRHLIRKETLAHFKPDACLINIARGTLINEADLADALQNGQLGGAALDVFEAEPLDADRPLWDLPNVLITPHCAGYTPKTSERAAEQFAEHYRKLFGDA